MRLILQGEFRDVNIPFVRMFELKFLVQFPVDHLSNPVVSSFILSLH